MRAASYWQMDWLLAVRHLRAEGVTSATFDAAGNLLSVTLGTVAQSGEIATSAPAIFQDDSSDLPPGAYDVVARAKREGK